MLFIYLCLLVAVCVASPGCHKCTAGNFTGTLLGAAYEIKVPANFNGVLVLYARDYDEVVPPAQAFFGGDDYETPLLNSGYALAGSNFGAAGWAVKEGITATAALRLIYMKVAPRCWARKVVIFGASMGGVIALSMAENFPKCLPLSAAVAACAPGAGTTRTFDAALRYNIAFSAINNGFPWGSVGNITPGLNFTQTVLPKVGPMLSSASLFSLLEFQRLQAALPLNEYYQLPEPAALMNFFYSTQALSELQTRAGGNVVQNAGASYQLSAANVAYLQSVGMSSGLVGAYTLAMQSTTVTANATARAYLAKYADFSGNLKVPVVTMHNIIDTLVPVYSESAYAATVAAAGKSSLLVQSYTTGVGHCNFTPMQVYVAVDTAARWAMGTQPVVSDFPSSVGFNMSFVPPAWPF